MSLCNEDLYLVAHFFVSHLMQNVPYQFATAHLPNCKVKIVLHNLKGESWIVNSIPTTRVQTSHTFCGGWLSFVRDNNINMGDICIFELVHKCELQVHIIRVTKEGMEDCNEKGIHKTKVDGSCSAVKKISRRKSKKINVKSSNDSLQWLTKVDKKGHGHDRVKFGSALKSSPISSQSISRELGNCMKLIRILLLYIFPCSAVCISFN